MKYISNYLRKQARKYSENEAWTEVEVSEDGINHPIYFTLQSLLLKAANEIEFLRKKVKELERIERIIKIAENRD